MHNFLTESHTTKLCVAVVLKFLENDSSLNYDVVDDTDVKIVGWLLDSYYPGGRIAERIVNSKRVTK